MRRAGFNVPADENADWHIDDLVTGACSPTPGIVQWMHLELADGVFFDNHPDGYTDGGWLQVLHSCPQPIKVTAGQTLDLAVGHDRATLIVMPMDEQRDSQHIAEHAWGEMSA